MPWDTRTRPSHSGQCPVPGIASDILDALLLDQYPRRAQDGTISLNIIDL